MAEVIPLREEKTVHSLNEIAALIKIKLKQADEVVQPYWGEIGDLLVEAKSQFEKSSEFYAWVNRQFGFSQTQARVYEKCAKLIAPQNRRGRDTLSDAVRSFGGHVRGHHGFAREGKPNDWRPQVDDIAERARREAERIRAQQLSRQQERDAERKLALRLIDIGYKVLAKELHPDAGGSKEAMTMLHAVRDRLKAHA